MESKKKKLTIEDAEIFPFSRQVIEAIQKDASGNVREILRKCGALIEMGYDKQLVFSDPSNAFPMLRRPTKKEAD